jgi:hypothetical protein
MPPKTTLIRPELGNATAPAEGSENLTAYGTEQGRLRLQAQGKPVHRKPDPCIPIAWWKGPQTGCGAALRNGFAKAQIK